MLRLHLVFGGLSVAMLLLSVPRVATADSLTWTLETTVQRALESAPEMRAANARVEARAGELEQAGAWPNPSIDLSADQKIGLEDGNGGTDLRYAAISQPMPVLRVARQRRVAEAQFAGAEATRAEDRLQLEYRTAHAYHMLQLADARLALAHERHDLMGTIAGNGKRDRLVRYLTPAERTRLDILLEQASQAIATAEGERSEAAAQLRALLGLSSDVQPGTVALEPTTPPPALPALLQRLDTHPALVAAQREEDAARAGVDAARSRRFADPVITLFRERDYIGGSVRDYSGVGLSVQVPLWNLNRGGVDKARADASLAQAQYAARRRDLDSRLRKSQLHLNHLIEQAENQRAQVLEPSRRLFELTRRSFAAGEVNVLALVDAHDSYFSARGRNLELLAQQWLEAADLRLAAGLPVSQTAEVQP
jgi:cobalt-zinc-cadmium efflux system outer membrane protein